MLSSKGQLVAVLFGGNIAYSDPTKGSKILWVTRVPQGGPLMITATRQGADKRVTRQLVQLGPSQLNLPRPGCWRLHLTWANESDDMTLQFHSQA